MRRSLLRQFLNKPPTSRRPLTTSPFLHSTRSSPPAPPPPPTWEGYQPDSLNAPLHSLPIPAPSAAHLASLSSSSYSSSFPSSPSPDDPSTTREETLARASIVFGTKLGGPAARPPPPHLDPRSRLVAGVYVPPKPEEPDNCCMSGCAHCVWDRWREEMEVWAEKSREAEMVLAKREGRLGGGENGDGSEGGNGDVNREELFGDVPVGIREFMRLEKKLKAGMGR